ncbi:MAG: PQQ-dependent sugar dehydrogenase [Acidobacteria bacterium]|nr:PQQ-dependent sugar dehydrogenase [Acidobacteriota bacterium]
MKRRAFALSALASSGLAIAQKTKFNLPAPYQTPSVNNRPQVISRPDGAQLSLPKGFSIEEFAAGDFQRPRFMLHGPAQEIILSDTVQDGSVFVLSPDGKTKKKILTGLDRPYGMALHKGFLYVGEPTSIKRYPYDAKAQTAGKGEELISYAGLGKGHNTRTLLIDPKAEKLYVTVGSESNSSPGEDPRRAAIHRYNLDGTGHETIATGTRNPIGLRFYPGTNDLWAAIQERDTLGDDLVPDYFTKIKTGGFYGWPYAYTGPNEDPMNKGKAPDMVKKTLEPDMILGAHVAVIDHIFYTGKMFPAKYQGGAFLCQHGSWNRSQRVGYNVVFVPFKNGNIAGPKEDFLTGWLLDPSKREVWGRPTCLLQQPDGSLLLTDDGGNKVWRISYKA